MKYVYLTSILCFFSLLAFAQPTNDDCADAELLTDVTVFCANYDSDSYTYDTQGSDCGPNLSPPNMWFSFVANGSILDMNVTTGGNDAAVVNLFAVDPTDPCNTLTNIFCTTTGIVNNLNGLIAGNTYYASIAFVDDDGMSVTPTFELCINSGDPQANSDPCQATPVLLGGCLPMENNLLASTNILFGTLCPGAWESQLWYTATLNPGSHILEVEVNGSGSDPISGDVFMTVGNFETGCMGGFNFIDFYCGPAGVSYEFFGLDAGQQYYVGIATNEEFEGEFELCTNESGPDPCVGTSNDCGPAAPTMVPITPVPGGNPTAVCVDGCMGNATPFDEFGFGGTCGFEFTNSTVWYNISTDGAAVTMNIEISNLGQFDAGAAALLQYDCAAGPPVVVACNLGNSQEIQLIDVGVNPNTNYVLAITDIDDNQGDFEVCVNTLPAINPCNRIFSITENSSNVDDSPIGGPYCPGEEVEFCIEVTSFPQTAANCQWLQAIIPFFGEGWDPNSFDAEGMPTVTDPITPLGGGIWEWFPDNDVDFNVSNPQIHVMTNTHGLFLCSPLNDFDCVGTPLNTGVGLPRGWYAYDNGANGDPNPMNGHPDVDYGDGTGCGSTIGPWTLCFTVTAREYPDCSSPVDFSDASIGVMIFADGEVGAWNAQDCIGQLPKTISASIACDETPMLMADNAEICSGQTFVVQLTSAQDPLQYDWTVDAPPAITGESDGSGAVISQTLTNNSANPIDVIYSVTGKKTSCPGLLDVTVTVYPEIDVTPINQPVMGCALQTFSLGNYLQINGGNPPYDYSWSNGSSSSNPQVQANADATFTVTVTDDVGCVGVGMVDLNIFDVFDVEITGLSEICETDGSTTLLATPQGGVSPFMSFDWQLPDGSVMLDAGDQIEADQTGTYLVTVKDVGDCPGTGEFEFTVNANPESNIIAFPEGAICEGSTTQLFEAVTPGDNANFTTSWIVPMGFTGDVTIPGFETDVPGDYSLVVVDGNGCSDTFTLTLDVQPSPEAFPASISICDPAGVDGVFDLTSIVNTVNGNTTFDVDFFEDVDLMNPIGILNYDSYESGEGTIYAVVYNDADCPSITVEVTLSYEPEIAANDANQSVCLEASGLGTFDLTLLVDAVNGNSSLPVVFYEDDMGATVIVSPENYESAAGAVYAQVDGQNGCFSGFAEIDLETDTLLEAFPASLTACLRQDGTGEFDLTTQNSIVTGGNALTVIWYSNSTPPLDIIADPTAYSSTAGSVFATVSDGQCIANVVEVDLMLSIDGVGTAITIDACNRGDNTGRFDLAARNDDIGGVGSTIYWYTDILATNPIADPTDYESAEGVVYAVVDQSDRCISEPIPITLNLDFLPATDLDSIKTCDPGNGIGTFDLTTQNAIVNGGSGADVEWFEDMALTISIPTPATYSSGTALVYAIVRDGECVSEPIDVTLAVTNDLRGEMITINGCDQGNGRHTFDLTTSNILISPDGLDIEYFTDVAGTVAVADATNFESGDATIYAVVIDGVCRSPIVPITLDVEITVFPPEETAVECDQGGGQGTFDLTEYIELVANAGDNVEWFEDAAGTTPIATPTNLVTLPRDVYARVTDADGCISDIFVFHLDTDNNLPAFPAGMTVCDDGVGMGNFDLTTILDVITGGNAFDVEFYLDQTLSNQVLNTDDYDANASTIYAITIDGPCQSLPVEIDLMLAPVIVAASTSDDLCDDGSGAAIFDLATLEATVNNGQSMDVMWYEDQALTIPIADINNFNSSGQSVWAVLSDGMCSSEPVEVQLSITTITGNADALETCDEGTGTGTFDLRSLDANVVSEIGQTVQWFEDSDLSNIIADPTQFVSSASTVYAVVSDGRCESQPIAIELTLSDKLPAAAVSLADCDDGDGLLNFNLLEREVAINTLGSGDVIWYENSDGTGVITSEDSYESGTKTIYAQVHDGPCRSDIIAIELTVQDVPTVEAGMPQQLDCRASFLDIVGSAPSGDFTYTWTTADGNIVSGADDLTLRIDEAGTYRLEVVNNLTGCNDFDEVVITEDTNLPSVDAGLDKNISCLQEETEIGSSTTDAGSNFEITWTFNQTPIPQNSALISVSEPGTYEIQVVNLTTGCTDTDDVIVTSSIDELTELVLDIDNPNCNGANTGCITITNIVGGTEPYSMSTDGENFIETTELCGLGANNYLVTIQDVNGCFTTQEAVIEQPEVLSVQILGNNIIDYGDSSVLAAVHSPSDVDISTYEWISNNHFNTTIDSVVGVSGLEEFSVSVTITDESGCTATDNIIVYVRKDFKVFAPNAFSPKKQDNINDRFFLFGDPEIVTNVGLFRIYSRWGEKLFERTNLSINSEQDGWDGTFKNEYMLPGTYIFYAEVSYVDGTSELIQGEFILVE